ncbi:hypothetical protein [Streptomyces sp.]|uniref:hypothetical protein n=1 Tax=Streptomyces sp. TaxID=1931 RepID=UPI002F4287A3
MSSTYYAICLSHDPALVIDREIRRDTVDHLNNRDGLGDHQACDLVIGRFSYPLIEVACLGRQLPGPTGCTRQHSGVEWIDSDWLRLLHSARPHTDPELLRRHTFGCWPPERLHRLRDELGLPAPAVPVAPEGSGPSPAATCKCPGLGEHCDHHAAPEGGSER